MNTIVITKEKDCYRATRPEHFLTGEKTQYECNSAYHTCTGKTPEEAIGNMVMLCPIEFAIINIAISQDDENETWKIIKTERTVKTHIRKR